MKIGDKVKVRQDLKVGNQYGWITFCEEMQTPEITIVDIEGVNFRAKENDCFYSPEMLIRDTTIEQDIVKIKLLERDLTLLKVKQILLEFASKGKITYERYDELVNEIEKIKGER